MQSNETKVPDESQGLGNLFDKLIFNNTYDTKELEKTDGLMMQYRGLVVPLGLPLDSGKRIAGDVTNHILGYLKQKVPNHWYAVKKSQSGIVLDNHGHKKITHMYDVRTPPFWIFQRPVTYTSVRYIQNGAHSLEVRIFPSRMDAAELIWVSLEEEIIKVLKQEYKKIL